MTNSTLNPFASSTSTITTSTSMPATYIIATAIIVSILLIFVLVGFWIYFSTCRDIAPPPPSQSRYTTRPRPTSTSSTNTLPGWFRKIAHSSPTLPLFKQNENDLALLREVIWSHPEDEYKPAKRRSAPKQRPSTSHPVLCDSSPIRTTTSPVSVPINAYIASTSSNKKPSLLARRHIRASKQLLALALPVVTQKTKSDSNGKKKAKSERRVKTPLAARLKISSPKLPNNVAERLAQRYHLISPLRHQVSSSTVNPTSTEPNKGTVYLHSTPITEAATASTSAIVLSPTIAHRRMLTSGPTEGDVIADLKSPYIYTPEFVRTPTPVSGTSTRSAGDRVFTPYRPEGMGGIDGVVAGGVKGQGYAGGLGGLLSPKLPHPETDGLVVFKRVGTAEDKTR